MACAMEFISKEEQSLVSHFNQSLSRPIQVHHLIHRSNQSTPKQLIIIMSEEQTVNLVSFRTCQMSSMSQGLEFRTESQLSMPSMYSFVHCSLLSRHFMSRSHCKNRSVMKRKNSLSQSKSLKCPI